jgi:hypothetical protein
MANQDDPFGINDLFDFSKSSTPSLVSGYKPRDPMAEMAALVKERNAMDVLRSKQVEAQNRAAFDNELADKAMNFDVYKEKAIANIENKTGVKLIGKARTEFADGLYDEMYKSLKSDKRYAPLREHFTANTLKPSEMEALQASTLKEQAKAAKKSSEGSGFLGGVGDVALSLGQSLVGLGEIGGRLVGANDFAGGAANVKEWLQTNKTEASQAERKKLQEAVAKAEKSGSTKEEVFAYLDMFKAQPLEFLAETIGPTLGIGALARAGGKVALKTVGKNATEEAAKRAAMIGATGTGAVAGAAFGVGEVKGNQYETTYNEAVSRGFDDATSKALAEKASEYSLKNAGQQALGAGLGAVGVMTGPLDKLIMGTAAKAGAKGLAARTAAGVAIEGGTEALQEGQGKYAGNVAAIDAGVMNESDLFKGVAGSAALGGAVGGTLGGLSGAVSSDRTAQLRPDATFETDNQPVAPPSATLTPQQRADLRAEYATSPETAIKKYADLTGQTEVNATAKAEQDAALQAAYDDAVANNAPEDVIQQRLAELDASVNATPEAAIASLFEADISSQESVGENAPTVAVGTIATLPNVISNGKELPDTKILEHTVATLAKSDPQVLYGDGLKVGDAKDAAAIESKVRGAISVLEGILSGSPAYANYDAQGLSDVVAENAAILQSVHDAVQTSNATRKLAAKTQREVLATKAFNDKQKSLKDADVAARKQAGSAGKPMGKPQADPLQAMTTEQIQQELQSLKQNSKEGAPNETKTTEGGQPIVETAPAVDAKLPEKVNANNTRANADRADAGVDANVSSAVPTGMPIPDTNVQSNTGRGATVANVPADVQPKAKANLSQAKAVSSKVGRVLQNRNRQTPDSIAQMTAIAANPIFDKVADSREMASGAPVVFADSDSLPSNVVMGRKSTVLDGKNNRYDVQYAVVEADSVLASNLTDGSVVAEYEAGKPNTVRPVAGNGRAAGVKQAYANGNADNYKASLVSEAGNLGLDANAVNAMRSPVLVRVMPQAQVTDDIGDLSNISQTSALSPVDQAKNDAKRLQLDSLEFDDNGVKIGSVIAWINTLPTSEASGLRSTGTVSRQAIDRLNAAIFYKAYGSDELVRLYAEATDAEAKNIITAAGNAAPLMAQLEGAGEYDIRGAIVEAVGIAVAAKRKGIPLKNYLQTVDFTESGEGVAVALEFADNARSAKAMSQKLMTLAQGAIDAVELVKSNNEQSGFFEAAQPKTRQQLFGELNNAGQAATITERNQQRAGNVDAGNNEQAAENASNQGNNEQNGQERSTSEAEALTAPTRADVLAQQERAANATALDAQQQAITENQVQPLVQQTAPDQRTNNTGDMFALEKAQAEIDKANEGKAAEVDHNQNNLFASEPTVDYNGNYESDLFGNPLPQTQRKNRARQPAQEKLRGDIQPTSAISDTPAPIAEYYVNTIIGTETNREIGAAKVNTPEQAAQATAYLYKSAVERLDGIVTDKDGNPLAIIGGFKGSPTQASVYQSTLLAEAVRIPGASLVWFSHNHPSGNANFSNADIRLNNFLTNVFRGSGIESMGLLVVSGEKFSHVDTDGNIEQPQKIPPSTTKKSIPVIERKLGVGAPKQELTSATVAKGTGEVFYKNANEPGLILLNPQNAVVGWFPATASMRGVLRDTGGLNAIYRAISQSNAASAIIVHGGELDAMVGATGVTASENIAAALKQIDVTTLDSINVVTGISSAETGKKIAASTVFSKSTPTRNPTNEANIRSAIEGIFSGMKDAWARVSKSTVVIESDSITADMIPVGNKKSRESAQAFYQQSTGKIYLIADRIEKGTEASVWLHEVFHKRGEELLGKENLKKLYDNVQGWKTRKPDSVERQIYEAANARATAAATSGIKVKASLARNDVRGGWTKEKVIKRMKDAGKKSIGLNTTISKLVGEYDNAKDLADHLYFHGTGGSLSTGLKPSITMSQKDVERIGGGGYGDRYFAISLSKTKRNAETFATVGRSGSIYPVLLKKGSKVVENPSIKDAADLEDYIEQYWADGVDAVWIGGGESELAVINPAAIVTIKKPQHVTAFGGYKTTELTDSDIQNIYDNAKNNNSTIEQGIAGLSASEARAYKENADLIDIKFSINNAGNNSGEFDQAIYDAEFLTYAIEEANNRGVTPDASKGTITAAGWMAKVKSLFTNALRKLLSGYAGKMDISANDLMAMAYGAAKLEYEGKTDGAQGDGVLATSLTPFDGIEKARTPLGDTKTVTVDGKEYSVFNSDGKPIHGTVEGVRNFIRWFGDSKVTDNGKTMAQGGKPLVAYHGTSVSFDVFNPQASPASEGSKRGAIFLTSSPKWANEYAMAEKSMVNPFDFENAEHIELLEKYEKKNRYTERAIASYLGVKTGNWEYIEDRNVQKFIKSEGFDGFYVMEHGNKGLGIYSPAQIKSSTGNSGNFNPANPDIRFSLSEDISKKVDKVISNSQKAIESAKTGAQRVAALRTNDPAVKTALLARFSQMSDIGRAAYIKVLDQYAVSSLFKDYFKNPKGDYISQVADLVSMKSAEVAKNMARFNTDLMEKIDNTVDRAALEDVMDKATFIQYDPSGNTPKKTTATTAEEKALKAQYEKLSPQAKQVYRDVLRSNRDQFKRLIAAVGKTMDELGVDTAQSKALQEKMKLGQIDVYFAQNHGDGNYVVFATEKGKADHVFFRRYESKAEAEAEKAALAKENPSWTVSDVTAYQDLKKPIFNASTEDMLARFEARLKRDGKSDAEVSDAVQSMRDVISSAMVTKTEAMLRTRKNIAGARKDIKYTIRSFTAMESLIAKVKHQHKINKTIADAQKHIEANDGKKGYDKVAAQQALDAIRASVNFASDKGLGSQIADKINMVGYLTTIAANISSPLVNLTSLTNLALPDLGAKYGFAKAAKMMLVTAFKDVQANFTKQISEMTGDLKIVAEHAEKMNRDHFSNAKEMLDLANNTSPTMSKVMYFSGWMQSQSERAVNLQVMLTAYKLEMDRSGDQEKALAESIRAVNKGNPSNAAITRGAFAKSNIGRVVLMLKTYQINVLVQMVSQVSTVWKAAKDSGDPVKMEEARVAGKNLAGILIMHGITAGVIGLPYAVMVTLGAALQGAFGDEEDKNKPYDEWLKDFFYKHLGKENGSTLFYGILGAGISKRIGIGDLIFQERFAGRNEHEYVTDYVLQALGAGVSNINEIVKTISTWNKEREVMPADVANERAIKRLPMPAVSNILKGLQFQEDGGIAYTKDGTPLNTDENRLTGVDMLLQAIGFRPSTVAEATADRNAAYKVVTVVKAERAALLKAYKDMQNQLLRGVGSEEHVAEVEALIDAFNERFPAYEITEKSIKTADKKVKQQLSSVIADFNDKDEALVDDSKPWIFPK